MRVYGSAMAGGPLNGGSKPTRTNPEPTRPVPSKAKPVKTAKARPSSGRKQGDVVPDSIRAAVRRDRAEGDGPTVIAARYGIHRQTVYSICKETAR